MSSKTRNVKVHRHVFVNVGIVLLTAALCLLIVLVGGGILGDRRLELSPEIAWEYCSIGHSRLVLNGEVVLNGDIAVTFCDYGLCFTDVLHTEVLSVYYNMLSNRIERVRGIVIPSRELQPIKAFDASSAMGIFCSEPREDFEKNMKALRRRVSEGSISKPQEVDCKCGNFKTNPVGRGGVPPPPARLGK